MLRLFRHAFAVAVLCAAQSAVQSAALAQSVPGTPRDLDFDAEMQKLDLDDPALQLSYKMPTSDGSSIGFHVARGDAKPHANFVPTNSSSIPEAEVVAYRLARFLGVSRNYFPVGYYKLGPKALAQFRDMVESTHESEHDRVLNRKMVLRELDETPGTLLGIYRLKPKSKMYPALSLGAEGEFNTHTPLARALRATAPMPDEAPMVLDGVKGGAAGSPTPPSERTVELARQLSTIFVIDQLLGQWDRFWANLEASGDRAGRLKLIARDNGGASIGDWEGFDSYSNWVSRYDRAVMTRLSALNAFLKGEAKEFAGYTTVDAWKDAVGFRAPESFEVFAKKLTLLIDTRLPALERRCGDSTYFPPKSADVEALDAADTGLDD